MSNPSSRSSSPYNEDFENLMSGKEVPRRTPETPPRKSEPKGFTPIKESYSKLQERVEGLTGHINHTNTSRSLMNDHDEEEVKKSKDEFDTKLKSSENFQKFRAAADALRKKKGLQLTRKAIGGIKKRRKTRKNKRKKRTQKKKMRKNKKSKRKTRK